MARSGRQHDTEAAVGDGGGVVHHPVEGIADALVVEGGHRQRLDPLEQPRAVVVVQVLGEADRPAEVEVAEQPPGQAEAGVGLVLGARGRVVPAREVGLGLVLLAPAQADRPDEDEQQRLEADGPEDDLGRRGAFQQHHGGAHEEGPGQLRCGGRNALDHLVHQHLHGPGQQQQREQAHARRSRSSPARARGTVPGSAGRAAAAGASRRSRSPAAPGRARSQRHPPRSAPSGRRRALHEPAIGARRLAHELARGFPARRSGRPAAPRCDRRFGSSTAGG